MTHTNLPKKEIVPFLLQNFVFLFGERSAFVCNINNKKIQPLLFVVVVNSQPINNFQKQIDIIIALPSLAFIITLSFWEGMKN